MENDIRIDSHKLLYHPEWVHNWLKEKTVYPLSVEIGLTNACNHRCIFCALDYLEYKPIYINTQNIKIALLEMKQCGLKSLIVAGEGEPLLHKDAVGIIKYAKDIGLDIGLSTNGALLKDKMEVLNYLSWIRFSVGGYINYNRIQGTKLKNEFEKVMSVIDHTVRYKQLNHLPVTVGVQTILLNDNYGDIIPLAKLLKEIEVDYFSIKPFSKHPQSKCDFEVDYHQLVRLEQEVNAYSDDTFKILFRTHCMQKKGSQKEYNKCHGVDSMSHIAATGDIYPCIAFLGIQKYIYGNINEESFMDIWEGSQKLFIKDLINYDMSQCREMCRLDEINTYLHRLKNPKGHDNFI